MLLGFDIAAALVHVQLAGDVPVVLHGEEQLVGVHDRHRAMLLEVARVHGARLLHLEAQHGLVHFGREHQCQLFQALDDLMHVLDDARDRLVLVDDTVDAERPDGGAAQRGEQQPPQRIAQRIAIASLERLESELGGIRVVLALGHFDQMRPDQPRQIKSRNHLE